MKLAHTIDEAGADDIEVADPDFITSKEIRVMPVSPVVRDNRKRDAPARSPDGVATKSRRTRASPTSVIAVRMRRCWPTHTRHGRSPVPTPLARRCRSSTWTYTWTKASWTRELRWLTHDVAFVCS